MKKIIFFLLVCALDGKCQSVRNFLDVFPPNDKARFSLIDTSVLYVDTAKVYSSSDQPPVKKVLFIKCKFVKDKNDTCSLGALSCGKLVFKSREGILIADADFRDGVVSGILHIYNYSIITDKQLKLAQNKNHIYKPDLFERTAYLNGVRHGLSRNFLGNYQTVYFLGKWMMNIVGSKTNLRSALFFHSLDTVENKRMLVTFDEEGIVESFDFIK